MREELQAIDTTAVEELGRIKQEQDVLQDRMETMAAKRGTVSEEVFKRVREDYEVRHAELEKEAEPLKARAREEFGALQGLVDKLSTSHRETQLAREEIQFRHSLGEFDDAAFDERVAAVDEQLAEQEAEVAEAEALVERFVAVFHSEEELRGQAEPTTAEGSDYEVKSDEDERSGTEGEAEPYDVEATAAGAEARSDTADQSDEEEPDAEVSETDIAGEGEPAPPPVPVNSAYATDALEVARLVGLNDGGDVAVEYNLQLGTTTIGRAPKNDIRIRDASVSREHAKIVFTERGFAIYDLGSENGVWVNGTRTKHVVLSEDDVVEFGPGVNPLVFRGP